MHLASIVPILSACNRIDGISLRVIMKDALEVFAVHFYEKPDDKHLRHGDLIDLKKFVESYNDANSEPPKVLNTIYPYFFEKYRYAAVTSQCCDLVRGVNKRKLKVDCIQLGAVLPFKTVFDRRKWRTKNFE